MDVGCYELLLLLSKRIRVWRNDKMRKRDSKLHSGNKLNIIKLIYISPVSSSIQHSPKALHVCNAIFPQHQIKIKERIFFL